MSALALALVLLQVAGALSGDSKPYFVDLVKGVKGAPLAVHLKPFGIADGACSGDANWASFPPHCQQPLALRVRATDDMPLRAEAADSLQNLVVWRAPPAGRQGCPGVVRVDVWLACPPAPPPARAGDDEQ